MAYLLFFLAGIFGANGTPHFMKGVAGEKHMTPFKKPSGPVVNVIWGTSNFFVAVWLFRSAITKPYAFSYGAIAFFTGVLAASLGLAFLWRHDREARGHE